MNLDQQIEGLLRQKQNKKSLASELGFFSKPVRLEDSAGKQAVVKFYRPLKNSKKCQNIITNHENYMKALTSIGINIPDTSIQLKKNRNKNQIIIIQDAFTVEELIRGQMESCKETYFLEVLNLVLNDTLKFWQNKPSGIEIGFHPTLRNYAIRNHSLFYFDTFPPMLMSQKELNKLIITMAPVKLNIRKVIPQVAINRVSNEYYYIDKMLTGIIGSCCRLRPDLYETILLFSREFISLNTILKPDEKTNILIKLEKPPKLSTTWVTFRKLFGKTGKPNLKFFTI